jgi:PIN domain nuclease of toxin-antitoxin system
MIYLDTHVVAWLYAGLTDHLSPQAIELIESNRLTISPVVQLELQYLQEIGRINADSALIIESLGYSVGLEICQIPFIQVVTESISQTWTRDPFDRLIVAQAKAGKKKLLTKDQTILKNYLQAIW